MKFNKKRITISIIFGILLFLVIIVFWGRNFKKEHHHIDQKKDESRIENSGSIAIGVHDENGKIIDNGKDIYENNIFHTIGLGQNLKKARDYLLIVLVDYEQVYFKCEGEMIKSKKIKLSEKDNKYIDIEFEVDENSKDLCYLFIKEPDYKFNTDNLDKAHSLQEVMTLRYNLSDFDKKIKVTSEIEKNSDKPITGIFLSESPEDLKVLYRTEYNKENFLTVGNVESNDNVPFAIIKLANWEQVSIGEENVKYLMLNAKERTVIRDNNVNIENDSNVQYLSFPYPYKIERSNFKSTIGYGTFRVLINRRNE